MSAPNRSVAERSVSKPRDNQKAETLNHGIVGGFGVKHPRIGIMGGTFDPIHNGHLVAASEVAWALKLDEVIFVPTGNPSFKQDRHVTAAEHRYLMTVIATAQNPQFSVSRVDIDRPGITYTIDTLKDLRKEFPSAELFFITGADAIEQMATWKDADKLFGMAKFVAVGRPGYTLNLGAMPPESVIKVEIPALAISSTDCRHRASIGEPLWYLVPDGVVRYIDKYALYRDQTGGDQPDLPSARQQTSESQAEPEPFGGSELRTTLPIPAESANSPDPLNALEPAHGIE